MPKPTQCPRHRRPRPCPKCAAAGHGGAGRGQGRKPVYIQPVKVSITLERFELDALRRLYPCESQSGSIRRALLELPEIAMLSEITSLARAAETNPPLIPRGSPSAEATLSYHEWQEVLRILRAHLYELQHNEFLQHEAQRFSQWFEDLPIPREIPKGARSDPYTVTLSPEDWRRVWRSLSRWFEQRSNSEHEEAAFQRRYYGQRELEDPRLREQHRLQYRLDTLRAKAAATKIPRPLDFVS